MSIDGTTASGKVTIALDFRTDKETDRSAYWNRAENVALLLTLLTELCGADSQEFFQFGVVTIKDVDLNALAERIKKGEVGK